MASQASPEKSGVKPPQSKTTLHQLAGEIAIEDFRDGEQDDRALHFVKKRVGSCNIRTPGLVHQLYLDRIPEQPFSRFTLSQVP